MIVLGFISDGAQPHLINIQFQKKVKLQLVVLYVDFKLDESYTPSKISIRAGDGFHNLKEVKTMELVKPTGWVSLSLSGNDPRISGHCSLVVATTNDGDRRTAGDIEVFKGSRSPSGSG
ncbi:hypothetical protein Ddye_031910 [Dipteronia dyeriana]|uniref:DOC domain-containing protein n=1 Tax=Dipteronia dyeriana TaxID=168575 RepID=A0AAD9TK82_9ROSI|nr:hypothetical protein Ddye_031910 [Dipteronia dyeriana]